MSKERLPSTYVSNFRKTHGRSISLAEGPLNETVTSHVAGHKDARFQQLLDFLPASDRVALSQVGPELRSKVLRYEQALTRKPETSKKFEFSLRMDWKNEKKIYDKTERMFIETIVPFAYTEPRNKENLRYDVSRMVQPIAFLKYIYSLLEGNIVRLSYMPNSEFRKMTKNEKEMMISTIENAGNLGRTSKTRYEPAFLINKFVSNNYEFQFSVFYHDTQ